MHRDAGGSGRNALESISASSRIGRSEASPSVCWFSVKATRGACETLPKTVEAWRAKELSAPVTVPLALPPEATGGP